MPDLMNHVEFRAALENAIKGKSANKAPFSIAWASGKLSRAHLARWAENHYHYVGPFADYLAYIYARMPDRYTDAKDFLLANMYEEEIGGDRHTDLLIRFAKACGTTEERVKDADNMTATTRGLQSWCYAVSMREDPIVAVAGLVVGLESQVPSIYRKQTPTLREKYKFTDEEVEFFDLHIVSDEIHGERGSLAVPDPNHFDGDVQVFALGADDWQTLPVSAGYVDSGRGFGIADLAATAPGSEPRAGGQLAYHVLEVMESMLASARTGSAVQINSTADRPEPVELTTLAAQVAEVSS